MNAHFRQERAIDVGKFISEADFKIQTQAYQTKFPAIKSDFIIDLDLLQKVLNSNPQLTGIRFMHGLADMKNPQSTKLFLIPCTNISEFDIASKVLISNDGYYDHSGVHYSIKEVAQLMSNFVQHMVQENPSVPYKQVIRGNLFGKNILSSLQKTPEAESLRYFSGINENIINGYLEPLNHDQESYSNIFASFTKPCPVYCGGGGESEECVATLAALSHSAEEELNFFRKFRDTELLKIEGGGMLYELYYFISPLIASTIHKKPNREAILAKIYYDQIQPFKQLVINNDFQAAVNLLEKTLDILTEKFSLSLKS